MIPIEADPPLTDSSVLVPNFNYHFPRSDRPPACSCIGQLVFLRFLLTCFLNGLAPYPYFSCTPQKISGVASASRLQTLPDRSKLYWVWICSLRRTVDPLEVEDTRDVPFPVLVRFPFFVERSLSRSCLPSWIYRDRRCGPDSEGLWSRYLDGLFRSSLDVWNRDSSLTYFFFFPPRSSSLKRKNVRGSALLQDDSSLGNLLISSPLKVGAF